MHGLYALITNNASMALNLNVLIKYAATIVADLLIPVKY